MFYKFSSVAGRLLPSTQAESVRPQGLIPLMREPSVIIFDSKSTKPVVVPPVKTLKRPASSAAAPAPGHAANQAIGVVPNNPGYRRIQEMQNYFLRQDGLLVWQKMGTRDRLGYYFTMGLMLGGLVFSLSTIGMMCFPQTKKD